MGKLTPKAETFQILRNTGKSIRDASKMAGFKGDANVHYDLDDTSLIIYSVNDILGSAKSISDY